MTGANKISSIDSFKAGITALTSSQYIVSEPQDSWFTSACEQISNLVKANLSAFYRAEPVSFENAYFAISLLKSICVNSTPNPSIVPGVSGDLQIEWHTLSGDLEIHVRAPNDVYVWYSQLGENPEENEVELTYDFTKVSNWLKNITETSVASFAAAA